MCESMWDNLRWKTALLTRFDVFYTVFIVVWKCSQRAHCCSKRTIAHEEYRNTKELEAL